MRSILVCLLIGSGAASASPASDAVARGEQLARDGRFPAAIEAFKEAEAAEHAGEHACLIGLAYQRLDKWSQAEQYYIACRLATPAARLPSWLVLAERDLDEKIHRLAPITVTVRGADHASIGVSSFPPDEVFGPGVFHLAAGRHTITATAPLHARVQQTITITDATPRTLDLAFGRADAPPSAAVPWLVGGVGVAALTAGALVHVFAVNPVHDQLVRANETMDPMLYDRYSSSFDRRRAVAVGLYAAGAIGLIAGVALRFTVYADKDVVGVEWKR